MRKIFTLIASLLSIIVCSSCSKDESHRYIYLAAKYKLTYAAINTTYKVSDEPAYFRLIPNSINVLSKFNKEESFYIANVKVEDNKPIGFGTISIKTLTNEYISDFTYVCKYSGIYGGEIVQTNDTKPEFIGKQWCRGHLQGDTFVRMEAYLNDVSDSRLILEFSLLENFEEPIEFDHMFY